MMSNDEKIHIAWKICNVFGRRECQITWDDDPQYDGWCDVVCRYVDLYDLEQIRKIKDCMYIGSIMAYDYKINIRINCNEH